MEGKYMLKLFDMLQHAQLDTSCLATHRFRSRTHRDGYAMFKKKQDG